MNRFLYAEANPATLIDPNGHFAQAGDDLCPSCVPNAGVQSGASSVTQQNTKYKPINKKPTNPNLPPDDYDVYRKPMSASGGAAPPSGTPPSGVFPFDARRLNPGVSSREITIDDQTYPSLYSDVRVTTTVKATVYSAGPVGTPSVAVSSNGITIGGYGGQVDFGDHGVTSDLGPLSVSIDGGTVSVGPGVELSSSKSVSERYDFGLGMAPTVPPMLTVTSVRWTRRLDLNGSGGPPLRIETVVTTRTDYQFRPERVVIPVVVVAAILAALAGNPGPVQQLVP